MSRGRMIDFTVFVLRLNDAARQWGGLRFEAETLVERWLEEQGGAR